MNRNTISKAIKVVGGLLLMLLVAHFLINAQLNSHSMKQAINLTMLQQEQTGLQLEYSKLSWSWLNGGRLKLTSLKLINPSQPLAITADSLIISNVIVGMFGLTPTRTLDLNGLALFDDCQDCLTSVTKILLKLLHPMAYDRSLKNSLSALSLRQQLLLKAMTAQNLKLAILVQGEQDRIRLELTRSAKGGWQFEDKDSKLANLLVSDESMTISLASSAPQWSEHGELSLNIECKLSRPRKEEGDTEDLIMLANLPLTIGSKEIVGLGTIALGSHEGILQIMPPSGGTNARSMLTLRADFTRKGSRRYVTDAVFYTEQFSANEVEAESAPGTSHNINLALATSSENFDLDQFEPLALKQGEAKFLLPGWPQFSAFLDIMNTDLPYYAPKLRKYSWRHQNVRLHNTTWKNLSGELSKINNHDAAARYETSVGMYRVESQYELTDGTLAFDINVQAADVSKPDHFLQLLEPIGLDGILNFKLLGTAKPHGNGGHEQALLDDMDARGQFQYQASSAQGDAEAPAFQSNSWDGFGLLRIQNKQIRFFNLSFEDRDFTLGGELSVNLDSWNTTTDILLSSPEGQRQVKSTCHLLKECKL